MSTRRSKERGSIMVVAMLVLTALVGIGGLTVLSVRGGIAGSGQERFKSMALYAAESGAAVAMDYLRANIVQNENWTAMVFQNNVIPPNPLPNLPGNGAKPGDPGNLFGPSVNAWYEVQVLNNEDDPGFALPDLPGNIQDTDGRVIIDVTGYGPNDVAAQIRWEVQVGGPIGLNQLCGGYGSQGGGGGQGSGNDCGSAVNAGASGSNKLGNP